MLVFVNWDSHEVLTSNGALNWRETEAARIANNVSELNDYFDTEGITPADLWLMTDEDKTELQDKIDAYAEECADGDFDELFEAVEPSDY